MELIEPWLDGLDQGSYEQVLAAVELLRDRGPHLGRPVADTVTASRHKNMKELRPGSTGGPNSGCCSLLIPDGRRFC